ncbi:putative teichuronic acid biosynthesis glycosyltransferase TuaH [Betaproteobacteria bacterium MOLA814]|nr:putative teichuronic acid biosynthesis glycosyltransferase TuaH [Betaproteobacteria bacterium MOLA814]
MRHRIMYIMNVDWDWAKQRPHFLAQHLSLSHDVTVFFPFSWRRSRLARNDRDGVNLYPFFRLPFGGRFVFISKINVFLFRIMVGMFLNWLRPNIVWISSPELFEYLPKHFSARLIYDCMDDVLAFPRNLSRRDSLMANEKELINACSHVFCSSGNLRDKLIARVGHPKKCSIVHNAFEPSSFLHTPVNIETGKKSGQYVLGYVGTISSWFDFEALNKIVNSFPSVEIHLLGPIENLGMVLSQHMRIKYLGVVRHEEIQTHVNKFDVLIMPFQVTELIQSVDPVKLYEYIFFDKPIVSVRYPEIERFSNFVDFYSSHEELVAILARYFNEGFCNKYTGEARDRFIAANTWAQRVVCIEEKLCQLGAKCRVR